MWSIRKTAGVAASAALLFSMAGTAAAAEASSAPPWKSCANGSACLYEKAKGQGVRTTLDCGLTFLPAGVANNTVSAWNKSGQPLYLFDALAGAGQPDILDIIPVDDKGTKEKENQVALDADAAKKADFAFYACADEEE